jgi:hypothetical protein
MLEVVTHPAGVGDGLASPRATRHMAVPEAELEGVVQPSRALSARERLTIYSNQYIWRLVDVLAEEFPAVRGVLGAEAFFAVARAYVTAHPSRHYSLSLLGARFARFLGEEAAALENRRFLADLARLERAKQEVFDAPGQAPVHVDTLLAIPAEEWENARFEAVPALALLASSYPVNAYLQATLEAREVPLPAPREEWVAVYRRDYSVWRLPLRREPFLLLESLLGGATLSEAIGACADAPEADLDLVVQKLREWFQDWTGLGFFAAVTAN